MIQTFPLLPILTLVLNLPALFSANEFVEMTKQPYFIDKSLLLEIMYVYDKEYSTVCSPPMFGRTTNLRMIQKFAQHEVDQETGKIKNNTQTEAYRLFKMLNIGDNRHVMTHHLARYPVLFLDFKFDINNNMTTDEIEVILNKIIQDCFKPYEWLIGFAKRHLKTHEEVLTYITKYEIGFMEKVSKAQMNSQDLEHALYFLCSILKKHFRRRVTILVDNYDHIAKNVFLYREIILDRNSPHRHFYRIAEKCLQEAFKNPTDVTNFGLLGAISGFVFYTERYRTMSYEESAFLQNHKFTKFFGFLEEDLDELFDRYNCSEQEITAVRQHYKGYTTFKHKNYPRVTLYCPYSIIQYLLSKKPGQPGEIKNYWAENQDDRFLWKMMELKHFRRPLLKLLRHVEDTPCISEYQRNFGALGEFWNDVVEYYVYPGPYWLRRELLFRYFMELGYLSHGRLKWWYLIPNLEVEQRLQYMVNNSQPVDNPLIPPGFDNFTRYYK